MLKAAGSPTVFGEVIEGDTAGYHFYPDPERADRWLADAGFQPIEQADEWLDGYGYRHLLLESGRDTRPQTGSVYSGSRYDTSEPTVMSATSICAFCRRPE